MYKLGLIGVGKMGLSHLAIANSLDDVIVECIADSSLVNRELLKKATEIKIESDYKKMIDKYSLDFVIISTPNSTHYEIVKYCINKGINVFVEKPFCINSIQSEELVNLALEKKVITQVGYVNRFNPVFMYVKHLIEDNVIGEINKVKASMSGSVVTKEKKKDWRTDSSNGGGVVFEYGSHMIDLIIYLFGPPVCVENVYGKSIFTIGGIDIFQASLMYEAFCADLDVDWCDTSFRKASNSIEIKGKNGKIIANKQEVKIFLENSYKNLVQGWNVLNITELCSPVSFYLRGEDYTNQLVAFVEKLQGKEESNSADFKEALITDKVIENIIKILEN